MKYQIQYRVNGAWVNGNTFSTHKEAEAYARQIRKDYQIKKIKKQHLGQRKLVYQVAVSLCKEV